MINDKNIFLKPQNIAANAHLKQYERLQESTHKTIKEMKFDYKYRENKASCEADGRRISVHCIKFQFLNT